MSEEVACQQLVAQLLSAQNNSYPSSELELTVDQPGFNWFRPDDLRQAVALAREWMDRVEGRDEWPLERVLEEASESQHEETKIGLTYYALLLFLTHCKKARFQTSIPPLEVRQPLLFGMPYAAALQASPNPLPPGASLAPPVVGAVGPTEDVLNFWREDPMLNDHHEHWHLVYPYVGRPGKDLGDRRGELFGYMHQQMLARYEAERLAVGLPRVSPLEDYRAQIPEGYDTRNLWLFEGVRPAKFRQFRSRPDGALLSDLNQPIEGAALSDQERFRDNLWNAVRNGSFKVYNTLHTVDIESLGNTVEASDKSIEGSYEPANPTKRGTYGSLHNDGHDHIAHFDNDPSSGVMKVTATAVRDPAFFRWHRHIDDLFARHQDSLPHHDLTNGPCVRIRSQDLILVSDTGIQQFGSNFNGEHVGEEAFGSVNWDMDFSSTLLTLKNGTQLQTTAQLLTEMRWRDVDFQDDKGKNYVRKVNYLAHEDFHYFFRLENLESDPTSVAIRVFLAPEASVNNRRDWIEMDKLACELQPNERKVVFRSADQSSVIRKPAIRAANLEARSWPVPQPPRSVDDMWCDCGWPYTMLLPRGTQAGMDFRLFVMLSPGEEITLPTKPCCTSVSYCGLQDEDYPDVQEMGYPFNRPLKRKVEDIEKAFEYVATRKFSIRCLNP